jgi:D-apiose dehydrogenase
MKILKGAIIGTGFWSKYQIPAWQELEGVELVAAYNRTKSKAEAIAANFGIPRVYGTVEELLKSEQLDFVDIITDVDTHAHFTELAINHGVAVICQKPMAPKMEIAKRMLDMSNSAGVPLFIHENFRWQSQIRRVGELLQQNVIGKLFKGKVAFCSAFPVFDNQPFLADLDEFILTDVGSHILDVCRFLFGEAEYLTCHISTINPTIKGEDVANVFMKMKNGVSCFAEMSYATIVEKETFPETYIFVEGSEGTLHLDWEYKIRITTREGTEIVMAEPVMYPWLDPQYAVVQSSIVDCNRNILGALQGKWQAETTGKDNFETVRLIHASYASARENKTIELSTFD